MDRKGFLKHLIFLMFFVFLVNFFAFKFYWYSLIWYLDIIMHFLGGFWVGLFFIYVFSIKKPTISISSLFLKVFLATLIIGVLWEIYEFSLHVISATSFDFRDTISDIFFDLLGSVISIFYFLKIIMLSSRNKVQSE